MSRDPAPRTRVEIPSPAVTDICDPSPAITREPLGDLFAVGTSAVVFTAHDQSDNSASASTQITLVDVTAPTFSETPADIFVEATCEAVDPATGALLTHVPVVVPSAADACDVAPTVTSDHTDELFPLGTSSVTFTATDDSGNTATTSASVTVVDTTAPDVSSLGLSVQCLWPPNHKYVVLRAGRDFGGMAFDACDPAPRLAFESVTNDQPDNTSGDGSTTPDAVLFADHVCLRAERAGTDPTGRTYTFALSATDRFDNVGRLSLSVRVPHDQSDHDCAKLDALEVVAEDDVLCQSVPIPTAQEEASPETESAAQPVTEAQETKPLVGSCSQTGISPLGVLLISWIFFVGKHRRRRAGFAAVFATALLCCHAEPPSRSTHGATAPMVPSPVSQVAIPEQYEAKGMAFDDSGRMYLCGKPSQGGVAVVRLVPQPDSSYALDSSYGLAGTSMPSLTLPANAACLGFAVFGVGQGVLRDVSGWRMLKENGEDGGDVGIANAAAIATLGNSGVVVTAEYQQGDWLVQRTDVVLADGVLQTLGATPLLPHPATLTALGAAGLLLTAGIDTASGTWVFEGSRPAGVSAFALTAPGDGAAAFCAIRGLAANMERVVVLDQCGKGRIYDLSGTYIRAADAAAAGTALVARHSSGKIFGLQGTTLVLVE